MLKLLFRLVRLLLEIPMRAYDKVLAPKPQVARDPGQQARVDAETSKLSLYQFQTCPFCIKVRHHIGKLGLKIELKDARGDEKAKQELLAGGGELQVPCLRIADPDGKVRWMYESDDINAYLTERFGSAAP
jgi:glutaredoxin